MHSVYHLLRKFCETKRPKSLPIFLNLACSLATCSLNLDTRQPTSLPSSMDSSQDHAKIIATQLSTCSDISQLNQIHAHVIRTFVVESYTSPFQWNNVIRSYARLEAPGKAVSVYIIMSRAGFLPDSYTLPIVLKAVCQVFAFDVGRQLHSVAIRLGLEKNEYCESGFIGVYSKAGEFANAQNVFDENPDRKLGSWNAIIGGLAQCGRAKEAINMFIKLKQCGFEPDDITMVSVISACGSFVDLNLALQLHKCAFQAKNVDKSDTLMSNAVIDMYGKCGRMDLSCKVFSKMIQKNVSSWTSMIMVYATNGYVKEALECFSCMEEAGVKPNHVTFVGVLSACAHGGMVREGKYYFNMMKNVYGIKPELSHYGCMVDLLGRAGLLEEARKMVEEMPMKANPIVWGCLMGACEKHENVVMAEWVAKHLQELEPWNDGVFVVLSNIYASRGLWEEVEKVRKIMKQRQLAKIPGYSLGTTTSG